MSRARPVDPLDEEADLRKRIIGRIELYYSQLAQPTEPIHKKDLPPSKIDELNRTSAAVKNALVQTDLASPADRMRHTISKQKPAGSNDVVTAVKTTGLIKPMATVFDLSSSMEKRQRTLGHEQTEALQKLTEALTHLAPPSPAQSTNKPELEPPRLSANPQTSYLFLILKMHQAVEETIQTCADHYESQINHDLTDLQRLREEKITAIEKYTKELADNKSWGTLETVARYVTFASFLTGGLWLINTGVGGPAGYLLIAAGGIGIGGSLAKDTGLIASVAAYMDKSHETQKHVEQSIDFVITIIPLGLALFGSTIASPANAPQALTYMGTALKASATLGSSVSANRMYTRMAEYEKSDANIFQVHKKTDADSKKMKETVELALYFTEKTAEIIANSEIQLS